jgi:D-inositol-3-phosphate glycosyltransferase
VECDVYTRADDADQPAVVRVEPGFRVHHVPAGPVAAVPKEALPQLVPAFTDAVLDRMSGGEPVDLIHANYWLSGVAGHTIKHALDLPLVCTFHTLDRVKADADLAEEGIRAESEAQVIGCSDTIMASCSVEAAQIEALYGVSAERIEIVSPAVDHAFFAPGNRHQARRALGLPTGPPMLLFVGRIQPLKSLDVAVEALAQLPRRSGAFLVVVGGPSGAEGREELARIRALVGRLGLEDRVRFVPPQRHELLSTFYRAADVCVVPSRSESFGLVALEAAACGTPVVAAAVGGLTTLVDDERTGYLVDGRDPATYAERIDRIVSDHRRAAAMSVAATAMARRYTWSIAAARLRRLYSDLTSRQLVQCA